MSTWRSGRGREGELTLAATVVADYGDGLMDVELTNEPGTLWRSRLIPRPGGPAWVYLTRLGPIETELEVTTLDET